MPVSTIPGPKPLRITIWACLAFAMAAVGVVHASRSHAGSPATASLQLTSPQAASAQQRPPRSVPAHAFPQRALLDQYCVGCHNERLKTANLMLDKLDVEDAGANAEVWEKVAQKLRSGAMPPAGRPRPDKATSDRFVSELETSVDRAAAAHPNPGRAAVHRLNRAEYTNAIRDLLALEIDGRAFLPGDDTGYGFDNIADVLSVSPGLLERYMSAAQKISRLAVGDPFLRPVVETYSSLKNFRQEDRASEDLPFGTRGGLAIRHPFPVDGEYAIRVRLQRNYTGEIVRGLHERNEIEVRLDGARVTRFTVGGESFRVSRPAYGAAGADPRQTADAGLEVRFPAKAGNHVVGVAFLKRTLAGEGLAPRLPLFDYNYQNGEKTQTGIDTVEIAGPYTIAALGESPSRQQIFVCRPSNGKGEEECARRILSRLAQRAYRRPVTDEDVQKLIGFYQVGRQERDFDSGIQFALEAVLSAPDFLFRVERDPAAVKPGTAYRVSDIELASRLSFFLWSSIPDEELLDLAARGRLSDPAVLARQTRRMLDDPRSKALVTNFAGQWLYLRNLREQMPDTDKFPDFEDNLREAMQRETELFFESQLREDHSVVDMLRANYTFLNERLARHYGIPNVYGSHFRRVKFSNDTRGGLLGQASILTVTSYADRTSPVLRGKWLLENILGAPPPAPPPDVPSLEEEAGGAKPRTMRERMDQHRKNPVCATCHAQIDPLGFALENFDAVGQWRTHEGETRLDASGALPDGSTFEGPAGLSQVLLSRQEEFVTTVIKKLATYALGRGVENYDMPAIRRIMREAAPSDYRWSSLIMSIVKSVPFQMRRLQS